jgi:small ligand-binding sensory domain FIST
MSENPRLENAVAECAADVKRRLEGAEPDFACIFVSSHHSAHYEEAGAALRRALPSRTLAGCSAGGVIGAGREVEQRPAVSVTAAVLPGTVLKTFAVRDEDLPDMDAPPKAWEALVGVKSVENPQFLLFADPFSIRADAFVGGLDYAFPKAAKVGGLASGADGPGGNALWLGADCHRAGLAGVAFLGDVAVDTVVAQGCRPIGVPLTVTDCQENVVLALDGRSPIEVLQELVQSLPAEDRELVRHSLFVGLVMDPRKATRERGDFLVRNIIGVDKERGYLAVGALVRPGQTLQFHLRDARTSAEDLSRMLGRRADLKDTTRGALLFSCLGRGEYLYGTPDHDSRMFRSMLGDIPLGGFFCNGEIGPVEGTTYLHGYTSCFGLFRPKNG